MLARVESATALSIARHTLQFILRCAVDADPKRCFGLIGRSSESTINYAVTLDDTQTANSIEQMLNHIDLQQTLKAWATEEILVCGMFFTSRNEASTHHLQAEIEKFEESLKKIIPEQTGETIIHIPLMLNTSGCLEAFACILDKRSGQTPLTPITLTLVEDGQRSENG